MEEEKVVNETPEEEAAAEETAEAPEEVVKEEKAEKKVEAKDDDRYVRLLAEYQNFKRRTEKEKADIRQYGIEKVVKQMLDVADNFERALNVETSDEKFKDGVELILKQFLTALENSGVSEIKALGEEFDPNFHQAIMMEDSTEYESGKVTCVIQKGYLLNNRVVRPAMVKVAN
ncbi:MAG: nucleotide exchange factor GrpE [Clostridia bacterium]|nr:nucleotide exchange factor GrpE [Clostridia bacterium]